jgi:hypothetical protein
MPIKNRIEWERGQFGIESTRGYASENSQNKKKKSEPLDNVSGVR